jgi:H+/Cl- antiporter ClcA
MITVDKYTSLYIAFIASGIIGGIFSVASEVWREKYWPKAKSAWIKWAVGFFILIVVSFATPSTKEMVAIYMIPKVANNEQIQKLPDNTAKFLNAQLELWIKKIIAEDTKNDNR